MKNLPFWSEKLTINANQECTQPEHYEDIDEVFIAVLGPVCKKSERKWKKEAN